VLLAEIEWSDGLNVANWAAALKERGHREDIVDDVVGFLREPGAIGVFKRPAGRWETWRERGIEAMIDGTWISAVVDRACVALDELGAISEARLFEFKTGRAPDIAAGDAVPPSHSEQIELNRRVLASAVGLPVEKVRAALVYTGECLIVVGGGISVRK
jgi:hypothetical protein